MPNPADVYKREEDRKWREGVDRMLVTLTTTVKVIQDSLSEIRGEISEVDEILRGSALEKTDGVVQQITAINTEINKLNRVVMGDYEGKGGLKSRVASLESQDTDKRTRFSEWLRFWTPVTVAAVSTGGLLFTNWPKIKPLFDHEVRIEAKQERTKVRKAKRRAVVQEAPQPSAPDEGSD